MSSASSSPPASVRVAAFVLAALAVAWIVFATRWGMHWSVPLRVGLVLVVASGCWRGYPLARATGVLMCLFGVGISLAMALLALAQGSPGPIAAWFFAVAAFGTALVTLMRPSAARFFGFVCPRCRSRSVKSLTLLYDHFQCVTCRFEWRRRQTDPSVFD